ncbi:hypothetical protein [Thalassotalea piscium]|uniref:Uncharacterized protein n=1 Tax=Thalassotalea piscium TaxID=1230533 RepID=A0A7X0NJZ1_9GAMM|nr:hypothetical protein [Thalassotalea piscium]MBB6544805.1 hypothetical protein [Thalassotalea piscium]
MFTQLAQLKNSSEMAQAIKAQTFYVVTIPLFSGYSIGNLEEALPAVFATLEEAAHENNDMISEFDQQVAQGVRDCDDEWGGEVMMAQWNSGDDMTLFTACGEHAITTRPWREMAGL